MDLQAVFGATYLPIWLMGPAFLFVITIIIVIHELGHFIAARACGVTVSDFSLGLGPEIFHVTDRKGTRWLLAWVPLGGYVKYVDDSNASSVPTTSEKVANERALASPEMRKGFYLEKPVWQRALIAAAGPLANFVLAIAIFSGFYLATGQEVLPVHVDHVQPGTPAEQAGLLPGDIITSVDGVYLPNIRRLQMIVQSCPGRNHIFQVSRAGQSLTIPVVPRLVDDKDILGDDVRTGKIGIQQDATTESVQIVPLGPLTALMTGTEDVSLTLQGGLCGIWDIVTGARPIKVLAGPTKILEASGKVASLGIQPLIAFLASVSIAIGMTNLLPIPVLDGGHLVFYAIEAIRGRPLSERTQEMAFRVGLAVVLMLLVVTTVNHLTGVVGRIFAG